VVDSLKISYGDYWRLSGSFSNFMIAALFKLFGKRIDFKSVVQRLDALTLVDEAKFQALDKQPLKESVNAFKAAGLELKFYYTIPPVGQTDSCAAAFLSPDRKVLAQVLHAYSTQSGSQLSETVLSCSSWKPDGKIVASADRKPKFNVAPTFETARYVGATPGELYTRHCARIARLPVQTVDPDQVERSILDLSHREIDFHAARGVYVPAPE
jgi:hypothetical protein